jgi:hypothetical protein
MLLQLDARWRKVQFIDNFHRFVVFQHGVGALGFQCALI